MTETPQPGQPADPTPPPPAQQYAPQAYQQQAYPPPGQAYPPQQYAGQPASLQYGAPAPSKSNGLAIGALVAGIVALLFCFIPFVGLISVLIGGAAVVLGLMAMRKVPEAGGKGAATAGIITGAIGAVLAIVWLVLTIAVFNAADDAVDDIDDINWDEVNEQLEEDLQNLDTEG
jgi:hypothetical protein